MWLKYPRELDSGEWDALKGTRLYSAMIQNRVDCHTRVKYMSIGSLSQVESDWLREHCDNVFYKRRNPNMNERIYFASKTDMLRFVMEFQGSGYE